MARKVSAALRCSRIASGLEETEDTDASLAAGIDVLQHGDRLMQLRWIRRIWRIQQFGRAVAARRRNTTGELHRDSVGKRKRSGA